MNYEYKYLKYKNKYYTLKNEILRGGAIKDLKLLSKELQARINKMINSGVKDKNIIENDITEILNNYIPTIIKVNKNESKHEKSVVISKIQNIEKSLADNLDSLQYLYDNNIPMDNHGLFVNYFGNKEKENFKQGVEIFKSIKYINDLNVINLGTFFNKHNHSKNLVKRLSDLNILNDNNIKLSIVDVSYFIMTNQEKDIDQNYINLLIYVLSNPSNLIKTNNSKLSYCKRFKDNIELFKKLELLKFGKIHIFDFTNVNSNDEPEFNKINLFRLSDSSIKNLIDFAPIYNSIYGDSITKEQISDLIKILPNFTGDINSEQIKKFIGLLKNTPTKPVEELYKDL